MIAQLKQKVNPIALKSHGKRMKELFGKQRISHKISVIHTADSTFSCVCREKSSGFSCIPRKNLLYCTGIYTEGSGMLQ
jgi:hypothetical protein